MTQRDAPIAGRNGDKFDRTRFAENLAKLLYMTQRGSSDVPGCRVDRSVGQRQKSDAVICRFKCFSWILMNILLSLERTIAASTLTRPTSPIWQWKFIL